MTDVPDRGAGAPENPLTNVPVEVTISVGKARLSVRDLLALGHGAVIAFEGHADHLEIAAVLGSGGGLCHADMGELRVRVDGMGHMIEFDPGRQTEERGANDNAGMVARQMGELRATRRIADGIDPSIGGLELAVHLDAAFRGGAPGLVEVEPL